MEKQVNKPMERKRRLLPAIVDGERTYISKVPKDISEEELIRLWKSGQLVIREEDIPKRTTDDRTQPLTYSHV